MRPCERPAGAGGQRDHLRRPVRPRARWPPCTPACRQLAPGRLIVGLGGAHEPSPPSALTAYLDRLEPVPATARVLAALGPRMLDLARDRAAGAFPVLVTPDYTASARSRLGDDTTLAIEQLVVVDADPRRARAIARGPLGFLGRLPAYQASFRGWALPARRSRSWRTGSSTPSCRGGRRFCGGGHFSAAAGRSRPCRHRRQHRRAPGSPPASGASWRSGSSPHNSVRTRHRPGSPAVDYCRSICPAPQHTPRRA